MGIRKMSWDEWIELDSNFLPYHDRKFSELGKDINAHVHYVNNAVTRLVCFEVLEELTRYLTHRYPDVFQLSGNVIRNTVTKKDYPYPASESAISNASARRLTKNLLGSPTEAMATAAKLVHDDLALMIDNDGELRQLQAHSKYR